MTAPPGGAGRLPPALNAARASGPPVVQRSSASHSYTTAGDVSIASSSRQNLRPVDSILPQNSPFIWSGLSGAPHYGLVAAAADPHLCYAMLARRDGESLLDLLDRLDRAIKTAAESGTTVDEINPPGGVKPPAKGKSYAPHVQSCSRCSSRLRQVVTSTAAIRRGLPPPCQSISGLCAYTILRLFQSLPRQMPCTRNTGPACS